MSGAIGPMSEPPDPIQPGNEDKIQEHSEGWLPPFYPKPEAEQFAERLAADENILALAMQEQFAGPVSDRLRTALAEYGYAVLAAWIKTGLIFRKCSEKNIRVSDPPRDGFAFGEVEDLAVDTVALGLAKFQSNVLSKSTWDRKKGASLTTFFVGQCLFQWPLVYERWCRCKTRDARLASALSREDAAVDMTHPDPSVEVEMKARVKELLAGVDNPVTRRIVVLKAKGYAQAEIAEILGITVGALESRLHRLRQKGKGRSND